MPSKRPRTRVNESIKPHEPPEAFRAGWLQRLDKRTAYYASLMQDFKVIISDLGGEDRVPLSKRVLIERFVFVANAVRQMEHDLVQAQLENRTIDPKLLQTWAYTNNSLISLATKIGLTKAQPTAIKLEDYIVKTKKKRKGQGNGSHASAL